jgi:hypothetical protein
MPVHYQLYQLNNPDAPIRYPYVAISKETDRIILISEEQVTILDPSEILFFESDYLPLANSFAFDLTLLDTLVTNYIGPLDYTILTRFNEEKHITLTYHSPTNEAPKDYDIYLGYPNERAQTLVKAVYPMFETVRETIVKS